MRASCRFAMAVHVLVVLAYHEGDRLTSAQLAESVNTNPVIIRRLLLVLKRARLVETTLGLGAGSRLSRSARRIDLAEIYHAVEQDEPFGAPSKRPNPGCPVGRSIQGNLAAIFTAAQQALEHELSKTTVADLVDACRC